MEWRANNHEHLSISQQPTVSQLGKEGVGYSPPEYYAAFMPSSTLYISFPSKTCRLALKENGTHSMVQLSFTGKDPD